MNKFSVTLGLLGLVASVPAYSIVSLHSLTHGQISLFGTDPVVAATGVLLLAGVIAYRLKKAK